MLRMIWGVRVGGKRTKKVPLLENTALQRCPAERMILSQQINRMTQWIVQLCPKMCSW